MPRKTKRKPWTKLETANFEKYIKKKAFLLKANFYKNIYKGKMKFRRPPRFFIEMSNKIGRTASQCKSKFQKLEKEIYLEFLDLPLNHFLVYQSIRNNNQALSDIKSSEFISKRMNKRNKQKIRKISSLKISQSRNPNIFDGDLDIIKNGEIQSANEFEGQSNQNEIPLNTSDTSKKINHLENIRSEIIHKINNGEINTTEIDNSCNYINLAN
jgi:hypothetical protein